MEKIDIREACEADADVLALLAGELGYPTAVSTVQERLNQLSCMGDCVLIALDGLKIVGMAVLHRTPFLHRPPDGRISALAVFEDYRGRGIGSQLIEAAEAVFRRWGCQRAEVSSGAKREAAHRFYNRAGYVEQPKRFIKVLT